MKEKYTPKQTENYLDIKMGKIVTLESEQECSFCSLTIPAGSQALEKDWPEDKLVKRSPERGGGKVYKTFYKTHYYHEPPCKRPPRQKYLF